jgi:hypothetical protein
MKKKWLLALLISVGLGGAQAGPYFTNKEGNQIWDKATGLIWMRCSLGQTWDAKDCRGDASRFGFSGAQQTSKDLNAQGGYGGVNDWQLPTIRQLASLINCSSSGALKMSENVGDGGDGIAHGCPDGSATPTIDANAFPSTWAYHYWTSTRSDKAWSVGFHGGWVTNTWVSSNSYPAYSVRLVRSIQLSRDEANSIFIVDINARNRADISRAEAERKNAVAREDAERKTAITKKRDAINAAVSRGPQQLYLLAGQSQRGKTVEINSVIFNTTELYELIIEKFPTSEFAVKATDQLTAMERSQNSSQHQRNTSRQVCEAQKATCIASCPRFINSLRERTDFPETACANQCKSVNCN